VTGCQWRALPTTFPPWQTVYWHWTRWVGSGLIEKILRRLRRGERCRVGRKADPSALIIDSQSVKASSSATEGVGYDAGKKIKGRKRHLLVDSLGNLIDVVVHSADIQDRDGAKLVLQRLASSLSRVRLIWADGGYRGKLLTWVGNLRTRPRITMRVVEKEPGVRGFAVLPRRWVIERTNAWLVACRRLAREYERCTKNTEAFIRLAMIRLLIRRQK
jgi:putative transposase